MVAPMLGAVIAAPLYWLVIEAGHPPTKDEDVGTVQTQRATKSQIDYETL